MRGALSAPASTNSRRARTTRRSRVSFATVEGGAAPRATGSNSGDSPAVRSRTGWASRCALELAPWAWQLHPAKRCTTHPTTDAVDTDRFMDVSARIHVVSYLSERPGGCHVKLTARRSRKTAYTALSPTPIRTRVTTACTTRSSPPGSRTTAPATSPSSTAIRAPAG